MSEKKDYQLILGNVANQLMNTIQMGISYAPNWSKEFSQKEILEKYENIKGQLKELVGDIAQLSEEDLRILGFKKWDEDRPNLRLIPLWIYDLIPDGIELTSIGGDKAIKGKDEIDLDVRFGCIPFGIEIN